MSRTDILSEIKKAEAEADAKVAQAEADKKTVIAEARRDSVKGIQDAEAKARSNYDSVIAKEQATVNIEKGKKLAEGEKESEVLEASSAKKIKKVNDLLIKEFERTINVSS